MKGILKNIWFQEGADEAVPLYTSLFEDSSVGDRLTFTEAGQEIHGREPGSTMTINFELAGHQFIALNGGPYVVTNPSISIAVSCPSPEEVDRLWEALSPNGEALMELDAYEWAPRYGWVQDRFGLSWQLSYSGEQAPSEKTVTTSFLFNGDVYGKAREAMELWTSVFEDSEIQQSVPRPEDPDAILWAQFTLDGKTYAAMESPLEHDFQFNDGFSLLVNCESQDEIDRYWDALIADGGTPGPCGWLKDRFGVSWQVAPARLDEMLRDGTPEQARRVTDCFMKVHGKLNLEDLEAAYSGKSTSAD